jgi:hypothetical protein
MIRMILVVCFVVLFTGAAQAQRPVTSAMSAAHLRPQINPTFLAQREASRAQVALMHARTRSAYRSVDSYIAQIRHGIDQNLFAPADIGTSAIELEMLLVYGWTNEAKYWLARARSVLHGHDARGYVTELRKYMKLAHLKPVDLSTTELEIEYLRKKVHLL